MIVVTATFGLIAYFEWKYLHRRRRSARTFFIVMSFLASLWMLVLSDFLMKERFSLGMAIADLFKPVQRLLFFD